MRVACLIVLLCSPALAAKTGEPEQRECADSLQQVEPSSLVDLGEHKQKPKRWLVSVNEESPCLRFSPEQAMSVELLQLQPFGKPYRLDISSLMRKERKTKHDQLIFSPTIVMLDGKLRPTREFPHDEFRYRGSKLSHTIFINEENADERFLLLYSAPETIGETDERVAGAVNSIVVSTGPGIIFVTGGADRRATVTNSASGDLYIKPVIPD